MAELVWKLSPSIIESYFSHGGCLRSLVSAGISNNDRGTFGFERNETEVSAISKAGNLWEENALQLIKKDHGDDSLISKPKAIGPDGKPYIPKYSEDEFVDILRSLLEKTDEFKVGENVYIYQAGMKICRTFLDKYIPSIGDVGGDGLFRLDISSYSYPDLIRVEWDAEKNKFILSIIDVKLAKKPKIEHKMQICMYILLLSDLIERKELTDRFGVDLSKGYLFNFGNKQEKGFETGKVIRFLKTFFSETVPQIIEGAHSQVPDDQKIFQFSYRVSQKCEWCPNYRKCIKACMDSKEEVMLLPYITTRAQEYIRALRHNDPTLELSCNGIERYLSDENNHAKFSDNAFWKRFLIDKDKNISMLSAACNGEKMCYAMRNTAVCEFPISEDIQVLLTSQKDSGFDLPYYWGLRAVMKDPDEQLISEFSRWGDKSDDNCNYQVTFSFENNVLEIGVIVKNMEHQRTAAERYVSLWHNALKIINDYNSIINILNSTPGFEAKNCLSVQHYVMDNYELRNLEETLFAIIEDDSSAVWNEASDLIMLLQGQSLVEANDFSNRPDRIIDFPVTILTTVIGKLFVLPTLIANNIVNVCTAFLQNGSDDHEAVSGLTDELFINKLSNVIKNDQINEYWKSGDEQILSKITAYMSNRLHAESDLIANVRKTEHAGIANYPPEFILPQKSELTCPELRRLNFEAMYEYKLAFQSLHNARSIDIKEALNKSKLWKIKRTNDQIVQSRNSVTITFELDNSNGFFKDDIYLAGICKFNDENLAALPFYNENYGEKAIERLKDQFRNIDFFDGLRPKIERKDGAVLVKLTFGSDLFLQTSAERIFAVDDEFLFFETISGQSLQKNIESIQLADNERSFFVRPWEFYKALFSDFDSVISSLREYGKTGEKNFTKSQELALKQLYKNNITLLLGPPGTGKTNFIARALISLIRLYKTKGKNLKVFVSANSHAAIENVLLQVCKMMDVMGLSEDNIDIRKLDGMRNENYASNIIIRDTTVLPRLLNNNVPLIVGSTMWRICKKEPENILNRFDIIVLDEASQVRMVDAVIPLMLGNKDSTRYLIVGDENQLPPIISGQYEKDPEKAYLLGSVFRYYYDCGRLKNISYMCQLNENFRMNRTICDYPAKMIYGSDYRAPNDIIGGQTLEADIGSFEEILTQLKELFPTDPYVSTIARIIDPKYPLVLCCVHGSAVEMKEREAEFVTKIVKAFQHLLHNKKGNAYTKGEFWGTNTEGDSCGDFGIVSPHHEHIIRLKNEIMTSAPVSPFNDEITGDYETTDDLFIGTVDKLQGQERQTIIVSYGVSDVDQALAEKEFIFSRNRLNVAITRAKKKCIVFLNDAVLSYPPEALEIDDQDVIDGLDFVCNFKNYMKSTDDGAFISEETIDGVISVYRRQK